MNAGNLPAASTDRHIDVSAAQQDVCVLVMSCDAYADAWHPFATLLRRYWPDCPFPIYFVSNEHRPEFPGIHGLALGPDKRWATNMLTVLEQLPHRQFIYLQEDYFLQSQVNTQRMLSVLDFARTQDAGFVRLAGAPDPDQPHANSLGLGLLSAAVKFRVSLQAAIWDRRTLQHLLVAGESGWDMEIAGTRRSMSHANPFFSVRSRDPILNYFRHTGILKGKWVPGALRLCRREGIVVDTTHRGIHGDWPFLIKDVRDTTVVSNCRRWLRRLRGRAA